MTTLDELTAQAEELQRKVQAYAEELRGQIPSDELLLRTVIDLATRRLNEVQSWDGRWDGAWAIAREVARVRELKGAGSWSKAQAEKWWKDQPAVAANDMATTFGPDWVQVVAWVKTWAEGGEAQKRAFWDRSGEIYTADSDAWNSAYGAVIANDGPGYAARRAVGAIGGSGGSAVGVAAALVRRSEVNRAHYEVLTRAAREVFGPIHPCDGALS